MLTCPNCGRDNPEGFQFCGFCAAPLTQVPSGGAEERKVVSVLFCDLVGFTASSDRADPEDVRATLRPYHERVRREIERAGGTVEKFIGDAVMAVFGAPVAHEDDAERAVLTGLKILDAIGELNEADQRLNLAVRIGVNTGEAVVTLGARPEAGEGMVTGDVVNTAARLQSAAPVGAAVAGELTYQITKDVFAYEPLQPAEVKGKAAPISVWRAIARKRLGVEAEIQAPTPFIGRDDDLSLMKQTFHRTLRERSLQLVTILGEPGVGKSRLVAEFRKYVDDLPDFYNWRQGRCLSYGEGITFWALGEIVKAQAGILETDGADVAASKLNTVIPEGKEREWLYQRLLPLVGLEPSSIGEREELFTAWRLFLESLAEERPSVLVFEDIHWADDALLDFIEYLADWAEGLPIVLLALARPELFERRAGWAGGKRNATSINLSPLSQTETASLVSALLDSAVLPVEIQSLILERVGGNPLYAEEFVRLLKDRGLLVRRGATYGLEEAAEVPFPETIQALIAARLDTLSSERKALLQDAAVIGKVFWSGALSEMSDLAPRDVTEALHELSRKELVRPARVSSMEGEAEYSFWHILVRDVAYAQIPRTRRAEKHRRAASWIESQAGERVEDYAEILAYHYTEALDLARAAGAADEVQTLEDAALRFLLLAGDRALGLDTAKAEAHFTRALDLAPEGHPERAGVLVRWADSARQRGRHDEAGRALEDAVAFFKAKERHVDAARAMTLLANVLWFRGDARNREVVADAVGLLESEPPGPELVEAYAEAGRLENLGGDLRQGMSWSERALALASEIGLPEPAKALGYRGMARFFLGDRSGLEDVRKALSLAVDQGRGLDAAILYNNLAVIQQTVDGAGAALETIRAGIDFCERRGITQPLRWAITGEMDLMFQLGLWEGIFESAEDLAPKLEATGSVATLVLVRELQARVLLYRGRAQDALPLIESAADALRGSGLSEAFILTRASAAAARLAAGNREGAIALLSETEETPNVREVNSYVDALPTMVRTAVTAGDLVLAERLASGLAPRYPIEDHALLATRAVLAEARGETEESASLYAEAADRWKGFGYVTEHALALLGRGRCLVALGRVTEAREPLREARDIWARLDAKPALAETDLLLEQAIALTS
ncbi:MAG TPA: adenylate/guanylate cyclase domain-containing protein [Actinomycetota bacterium]|nr:adenylate/guanylate cyclase domain-containing protein [Actinomycetota bacterium]